MQQEFHVNQVVGRHVESFLSSLFLNESSSYNLMVPNVGEAIKA